MSQTHQSGNSQMGNEARVHSRSVVRDHAWTCPSCGNILGYLNRDKTVLRSKYKDFYIYVEEARSVVTLCRRCGKECVLTSDIKPAESTEPAESAGA